MTHRIVSLLTCMILCITATTPAWAKDGFAASKEKNFKPALIYVLGDKDSDRAFVDAARAGAERAEDELGVTFTQYRMHAGEDVTARIKTAADSGANPIIAVGFQNVMPVLSLAERYPNTHFTVIDGLVPPLFPNVQSVIFKDHEGAFLVGIIAAITSKTKHIGFIGGMDVPIIRNFALGFAQGVRHADPQAKVDIEMIGNTTKAWSDPGKAREIALTQYASGIDVIFAAAGGSGVGALEAAKETDNFAIGVDINQNALFPGNVLTSLIKRVDIAVYDALKTSKDGKWSPGIKYLGLKEGALDYAVDEYNRHLMNEEMIDKVATAKERIINGLITVQMYSPK
ncbi:MAG: BMP family ABC transporter substrate-binding protein [Alphaproteobacteria bacterium]|nr:BMP family ABC transporter substrate-binding protein [Alphaproteobacteria bacterium]